MAWRQPVPLPTYPLVLHMPSTLTHKLQPSHVETRNCHIAGSPSEAHKTQNRVGRATQRSRIARLFYLFETLGNWEWEITRRQKGYGPLKMLECG